MVIKLLPVQIPAFWEAIKFTSTQADEVEKKNRPVYLNRLLHSLLNDKSQCFVRLDNERRLHSVMITNIEVDKISGEETLNLLAYYSWIKINNETWSDDFVFAKNFAVHNQCEQICFSSHNPRICEMSKRFGFKEKSRLFAYKMEV